MAGWEGLYPWAGLRFHYSCLHFGLRGDHFVPSHPLVHRVRPYIYLIWLKKRFKDSHCHRECHCQWNCMQAVCSKMSCADAKFARPAERGRRQPQGVRVCLMDIWHLKLGHALIRTMGGGGGGEFHLKPPSAPSPRPPMDGRLSKPRPGHQIGRGPCCRSVPAWGPRALWGPPSDPGTWGGPQMGASLTHSPGQRQGTVTVSQDSVAKCHWRSVRCPLSRPTSA